MQRLLRDGQLTAGHARALLGTPDRTFQEALARRVVTETLSVRQVEEAVKARGEVGAAGALAGVAGRVRDRLPEPGLRELEELLASKLDTRVKVEMGPRKGRVVIEFADLEDLERIYRVLSPDSQP